MLVQLTEKGRTIRPDFEKISKKLQKKVVGDMPSDDRETLVRLLMQVAANLEK
jgi:DNA-binding MarR family transcriptional regulator